MKVGASLLDDTDLYDVQTGLAGWMEPVIVKKMLRILGRGLGKRVKLVAEWPHPCIQVGCWWVYSEVTADHCFAMGVLDAVADGSSSSCH